MFTSEIQKPSLLFSKEAKNEATLKLHKALDTEDYKSLIPLLHKKEFDANQAGGIRNLPPLFQALTSGNLNPVVVELLLQQGANPNFKVKKNTPIDEAIMAGYLFYSNGSLYAKESDEKYQNLLKNLENLAKYGGWYREDLFSDIPLQPVLYKSRLKYEKLQQGIIQALEKGKKAYLPSHLKDGETLFDEPREEVLAQSKPSY